MSDAEVARRLRQAAAARPLKLPVNRRVDESHHHRTAAGLEIWFTMQLSSALVIHEAVFQRDASPPGDGECRAWLKLLAPELEMKEAPGIPGAFTRRFEHFAAR